MDINHGYKIGLLESYVSMVAERVNIHTDKITLLETQNSAYKEKINYLEKEMENMKLDFLIKLDQILNKTSK